MPRSSAHASPSTSASASTPMQMDAAAEEVEEFSMYFGDQDPAAADEEEEGEGDPDVEDALDSEDEAAWDEVDVTVDQRASTLAAAAAAVNIPEEGVDIVISKGGQGKRTKAALEKKSKEDEERKRAEARGRMYRQQLHKTHTIAHLALGLIRNRWIEDPLLQAIVLSHLPLHLFNAFFTFNSTTVPNERDRTRLFDTAFKNLVHWWWQAFDLDDESKDVVRRKSEEEVQEEILEWDRREKQEEALRKGKGKGKKNLAVAFQHPLRPDSIPLPYPSTSSTSSVPNPISILIRAATLMKGSRDASSQLFTCLCRALDIPARLVFSFQPVEWRLVAKPKAKKGAEEMEKAEDGTKAKGKNKVVAPKTTKGKGKMKMKPLIDDDDSDESDEEVWDNKRAGPAPAVRLRKSQSAKKRSESPDAYDMRRPPVFWTEIYHRTLRKWITVDPVRNKVDCAGIMEPKGIRDNKMMYVVAFEQDKSIRDVTARYFANFLTEIHKIRCPSRRGENWFRQLLQPYLRRYELNRDREETQELRSRIVNVPMPRALGKFKNHPTYAIAALLNQDETIRPSIEPLGLFNAIHPVYPRSAVIKLKSKENFRREGRVVKEGEEPLKLVKKRNVTVNKIRIENAAVIEGKEVEQQPLYGEYQTELYKAPPVVDGKIPKNDFGNIDLFVDSMLPAGAVHIPYRTAAKCAKGLGIDYADAITGFDFKQRRAVPRITGIVVAADIAEVLLEQIEGLEQIAGEKEFAARQDRALKNWKSLIIALRIRHRLQASYGKKDSASKTGSTVEEEKSQFAAAPSESTSTSNGVTKPSSSKKRSRASISKKEEDDDSIPANRSTTGHSLRFTMSPEKPSTSNGRTTRPTANGNGSGSKSEGKGKGKGKGEEVIVISDDDDELEYASS